MSMSDAEIKAAFDLFDKDKKGTIDAKELREVLKEIKEDESLAEPIIKALDRDGDGEISFDEFKKALGQCKS